MSVYLLLFVPSKPRSAERTELKLDVPNTGVLFLGEEMNSVSALLRL